MSMDSKPNGESKMNGRRMIAILHDAIVAYEFELEQQDYESAEKLHAVVLNEIGITESEYLEIMGRAYSW